MGTPWTEKSVAGREFADPAAGGAVGPEGALALNAMFCNFMARDIPDVFISFEHDFLDGELVLV